MRKLYRALTSAVLLAVLFFTGLGAAFAVPDIPPSVIPVVDDSNTLNADQLIIIGNTANVENNKAKVYTYIVPEIPVGHNSAEAAAEEVFNAWSLGINNGVLIYIVKTEGEIVIHRADSLAESLPAAEIERILNESIIPSLSGGDYASGISNGISDINTTIDNFDSASSFNMSTLAPYLKWGGIIIGSIIAMIILFFIFRLIVRAAAASVKSAKNELEHSLKNELDEARKENKKLLSQVASMKKQTGHSPQRIDEAKLKQDLVTLYQSNPDNFFSIFDSISGVNTAGSSKTSVNSSNNSLYDGNKFLDDLAASSSSSSSYSSYSSSPYSSSYNSSYSSDYKTSYSSDFGTNSDLSSDDD